MPLKHPFIYIVFLCLFSCNQSLDNKLLTGYWQIEKVTQGGETFYPALGNTQFDYYFLRTDNSGFRKKLSPSLGTTLNTSQDQTNFQLLQVNGKWVLSFETPWDQWNETIVRLTEQDLVLAHKDRRYTYQRKEATDGTF